MSSITAGTTSTTTLIHSGDTTGSLVFKTNDTGSGGTTAVTIDTSQNVGIGTSSPTQKLEVKGNQRIIGDSAYILWRDTADSASSGVIQFPSASAATIGTYVNQAMLFQTNNTERMRIDSSGNLLVGTTSANGTEKFNVTSSSTEVAFFSNSSNTNAYSGIRSNIGSGGNNTTTWHYRGETRGVNNWYLYGNGTTSYSSDSRLKKNIENARGYLEDLNKLRVVKYQWNGDDPNCQQVELGLIAQEVEEIFPKLVQEHEIDGIGMRKNIKQSVLPFMMLKAIQELKAINDQQAQTITAQSEAIASLTARVVALEGK